MGSSRGTGWRPFPLTPNWGHMAGRSIICLCSLPHASSCASPPQGHGPDLQAAPTPLFPGPWARGGMWGHWLERERASSPAHREAEKNPPALILLVWRMTVGPEPQGSEGQVRPCTGADRPPPWVNEG